MVLVPLGVICHTCRWEVFLATAVIMLAPVTLSKLATLPRRTVASHEKSITGPPLGYP